jgi:3-phytase
MHTMLALVTAGAVALSPGAPKFLQTLELPSFFEGFHNWPADEISGMEYLPRLNELLIVPDDRSQRAPARLGRIRLERVQPDGWIEFGPIRWTALVDERGESFEKNTVDPEGVRLLHLTQPWPDARVVWVSEGYGKGGVQPAIYEMNLDGGSPRRWNLPEAFLHDNADAPTRGVRHNLGFESVAVENGPGGQTIYAAVERPLIQDEGSGLCRVLVRGERAPTRQIGYPLGPAPEGTDPASLSLAELISVAPRRLLALENADRPDGVVVSTLWWCSTETATNLSAIDALPADGTTRPIEKKLLLDFSTLPDRAGLGDFEAMAIVPIADGQRLLLVGEDNGGKGTTRVLVFRLPNGLER